MDTSSEQIKAAFTRRFRAELERLGMPLASPTKIARAFNLKFPEQKVTAQAMRKWLLEDGIPTQPNLVALARWLGVSPQWLRYGTGARDDSSEPSLALTPPLPPGMLVLGAEHAELLPLIDTLTRLTPNELKLVRGLVEVVLQQRRT